MRSRSRAFTLIELLVVIAIIAILAAILFPVFAQARQAARAASSQSNLKQMTLGILMYVQDYDETFPMDHSWGYGALTVGGMPFTVWAYDILPYLKNGQIFADPMAPGISQQPVIPWWPFLTSYGYNYTALSPYTGAFEQTPWIRTPTGIGAINRPAELVMLAGKAAYADFGNSLWWYGAGTLTTLGTVDPPECATIPMWCFGNWGVGGAFSSVFNLTEEAGGRTGGVSLRKSGNTNMTFTDGHAKFMPPAAAAAGTNWHRELNEADLVILDPTRYMWHTSP
jgi:prepilin-type N-terminal cleavage/methylation domain-containing protein/prepilin-type processing-associated H-X9-DG protein